MTEKRIIRTIPTEMHLAPPQVVIYDGMEDWIDTEGIFDHTVPGVLYASEKTPIFGTDSEGNRILVSEETVLVPPHASIKQRHTFGSWNGVGKIVELPVVEEL